MRWAWHGRAFSGGRVANGREDRTKLVLRQNAVNDQFEH